MQFLFCHVLQIHDGPDPYQAGMQNGLMTAQKTFWESMGMYVLWTGPPKGRFRFIALCFFVIGTLLRRHALYECRVL